MTKYRCYRLGCDKLDRPALPWWKFHLSYSKYRRHLCNIVAVDYVTGDVRLDMENVDCIAISTLRLWTRLRPLVEALVVGKEIGRSRANNPDDLEDGGMGVLSALGKRLG